MRDKLCIWLAFVFKLSMHGMFNIKDEETVFYLQQININVVMKGIRNNTFRGHVGKRVFRF